MATGIIVTGHGRFAEGLTTSIELIAGPQENYIPVNFEHETEQLQADLVSALESLKECSGILIFADLAGGSPYKTAALLTQMYPNVELVAGTNLPMLCEIVMARTIVDDAGTLADMAVATGKDQISRFDLKSLLEDTEGEEELSDGI